MLEVKEKSRIKAFAALVVSDADALIGRTVLKATGQHFDEYVASGGVPPYRSFSKPMRRVLQCI